MNITSVENTPNPNALKFNVESPLAPAGTRNYNSAQEAAADPLASAIFKVAGVTNVFVATRFVSVTKNAAAQWAPVKSGIEAAIRDFKVEGAPCCDETHAHNGADESAGGNGDALTDKITEVLNSRIRPALAMDGGGVQLIGVDGHSVKIHYQGACGSCPSSAQGTLMAIERMLREEVAPDLKVVNV